MKKLNIFLNVFTIVVDIILIAVIIKGQEKC